MRFLESLKNTTVTNTLVHFLYIHIEYVLTQVHVNCTYYSELKFHLVQESSTSPGAHTNGFFPVVVETFLVNITIIGNFVVVAKKLEYPLYLCRQIE